MDMHGIPFGTTNWDGVPETLHPRDPGHARLSRAEAALRCCDFVTPADVKALAVPALAHRLLLRPEL
jgi:MoxR-like ATPase